MDLAKLPVFLENQQKGDYTVHLDPAATASDADHPVQPELRRRPRDRQVAHATRTSATPSRSASTATSSTRRSGSASGRPGSVGAGRDIAVQPRARVAEEVGHPRRRSRPTSCSTRSGWTRRTPRASACGPTARAVLRIEMVDRRRRRSSRSPKIGEMVAQHGQEDRHPVERRRSSERTLMEAALTATSSRRSSGRTTARSYLIAFPNHVLPISTRSCMGPD